MVVLDEQAELVTEAEVTPPKRRRLATRKRARRPSRRLSVGWLVAAAACFVLAAGWVLWALGSAGERHEVLVAVNSVAAGEVLESGDVGVASVALDDASVGRVYVPSQREVIVGAVTAVPLEPGDLLGPALLDAGPDTSADEETVGALLPEGRYPGSLKAGDQARAVFVTGEADPVLVRVLSISSTESGQLSAVLAVPSEFAPSVAKWAGSGDLVLTGIQAGSR